MSAHRCEACGWAHIATHEVDFGDGQRAFRVCLPCARIVEGGKGVVITPLPLAEVRP